jgi:outer membrane receptor for ferrienterochelin and colicins
MGGENLLTIGGEYVEDDVLDVIEAYNYKVDQLTKNMGLFMQSDWEITQSINLLSGVRADQHNMVDKIIISPRIALLYKLKTTQLRLTWGQGFRAPQAFDSDLHIAFAGGGVSRISLGPGLKEERSNSVSGSVNYDKATAHYITGITVEGFYTHLNDAFYLHPMGEDNFGQQFEKRNGAGATVQGATFELRANYDQKAQLEVGITMQSSLYDEAVSYSEELAPKRIFLRTPDEYGYAILTLTPIPAWTAAINWVFTGPMMLVHLAGAPEQQADEYTLSSPFHEWSFKLGHSFPVHPMHSAIEVFGGVKNLTNTYQDDFDSGKNRDSNYIYGPGLPRTIFIGLRLKSL